MAGTPGSAFFGPRRHSIANFPIQIDVKPFLLNADLIKSSTFGLARRLGDMTEPLTISVHKVITPSMGENFMKQGRPQWESLSMGRLEQKLATGNPYWWWPLVDRGILDGTVFIGHYWRITPTQADMEQLDTVVQYAKYHQRGTKKMPARPFAVLQKEDIHRIEIIFEAWIKRVTGMKDYWPYYYKP